MPCRWARRRRDYTLHAPGSGTVYTLSEQVKSGPVVLSFYREQW